MTLNPIQSKRTLALSLQTLESDRPQSGVARAASTGTTASIGVIVDDGTQVTEHNFCNAVEIDLLREFWNVVRPDDVFVATASRRIWPFLDSAPGI
jgi:hypothetical protein